MNKALITSIVAVLIVTVGLFVAGQFLRTPFSAQPSSTPVSSQVNNVTGPVVVTTSPSASTTQTQGSTQTTSQPSVSDQSFADILAQFQAQEISFTSVHSSTGSFGPVYTFYADDISTSKKVFPKAQDYSLHMASVDLNHDGVAEILVYEDLPGFCGTAGCPFAVYQKRSGAWAEIFDSSAIGTIGLSQESVNGYDNLYISTQVVGYVSNVVRYSWNNKTYAPKEAVAQWDGTQFKPLP